MYSKELMYAAQEVLDLTDIVDSYHCESGELHNAAEQLIIAYQTLGLTEEGIMLVFTEMLTMKKYYEKYINE